MIRTSSRCMTAALVGGLWLNLACPVAVFARDPAALGEQKIDARKISYDMNKDEIPDRFEYYEQGVLTRVEADSNYDGKIDEWGVVKDGKLISAKKDIDGDGKVDKWVDY